MLVGPANMGSPSVYGAYANGPSALATSHSCGWNGWIRGTITHSSVIPVVSFLETRLRDVASTWPGLLSVLPTMLGDLDPFGGEKMARSRGEKHAKRHGSSWFRPWG